MSPKNYSTRLAANPASYVGQMGPVIGILGTFGFSLGSMTIKCQLKLSRGRKGSIKKTSSRVIGLTLIHYLLHLPLNDCYPETNFPTLSSYQMASLGFNTMFSKIKNISSNSYGQWKKSFHPGYSRVFILVHVDRFHLNIYTIRHALFNIGDSSLNDELFGQNTGETSLAGAILNILQREIQNKRWVSFQRAIINEIPSFKASQSPGSL